MSYETNLICCICEKNIKSDEGFILIKKYPAMYAHFKTCKNPLKNHQVLCANHDGDKTFKIKDQRCEL